MIIRRMQRVRYHFVLDVLVGFFGLLATVSILWIALALLGALVAGALVLSIFGAIFFVLSRLARAAQRRANPA